MWLCIDRRWPQNDQGGEEGGHTQYSALKSVADLVSARGCQQVPWSPPVHFPLEGPLQGIKTVEIALFLKTASIA